jgi:hypothetical protein
VLVRFPENQNRDKLVARWNGPNRVLKVDSESVIVVCDTVREEVKTVHIDDRARLANRSGAQPAPPSPPLPHRWATTTSQKVGPVVPSLNAL